MYLWAIALGSGVLVVVWFMQLHRAHPDYYVLFGHPVLLVQCVWATVWLLQGRPLIVAERVVFVVNALAILVQMLLSMLDGPQQMVGPASAAYWMLVALSILGFLIFGSRQALLLSAGFYTVGVVLPWTALIIRGSTLLASSELIRVQLTCGVVLVLLSVLAWYRERFTMEQGQRLSLERLANTDPMTQLPNRRALYREIETLLADVRGGAACCLILLDVDHFKRINDSHGHNVGDDVLIRLAARLRSALRDHDTVGRWGGEEFLIMLPGVTAQIGARVAERLRHQIADQVLVEGVEVSASFGVTDCTPADDLRSCTARADHALYAAKTSGRNRVVVTAAGPAEAEVEAPGPALTLAPVPGTD